MDEKILDTEKFYIKTKVEQKDWRKIVFFATFLKRRCALLVLFCVSLMFSVLECAVIDWMSIAGIIFFTAFFFVIFVLLLMLRDELYQKKFVKSDNMGVFNTLRHFRLYENDMIMQNEKVDGYNKVRYDQFFEVIEIKGYYLLYVTLSQIYVIRKVDVEDTAQLSNFLKEKLGAKYSKR